MIDDSVVDDRQKLIDTLSERVKQYAQDSPEVDGIVAVSHDLLTRGIMTFEALQSQVLEIFTKEFIAVKHIFQMDIEGWTEVAKMGPGKRINREASKELFPFFWNATGDGLDENGKFQRLQSRRDHLNRKRKDLLESLNVNIRNFFTSSR